MTLYLAELFPLVQINTLRGQLLITYTSEKISSKDAWTHSHTVPSISCHLTATSPSFMLRHWAIYNNSTSNAHLSMCRLVNSFCAARRLISLKPHCVSLTPRTHRNQTKKWNPFIKIVLKNDLYNNKSIPLVTINHVPKGVWIRVARTQDELHARSTMFYTQQVCWFL